jgi:hypothetical protein
MTTERSSKQLPKIENKANQNMENKLLISRKSSKEIMIVPFISPQSSKNAKIINKKLVIKENMIHDSNVIIFELTLGKYYFINSRSLSQNQ